MMVSECPAGRGVDPEPRLDGCMDERIYGNVSCIG